VHLLGLASLGTEARGGRGTVEVLGQHGGEEGVEDNLSTAESGQSEPKQENELKGEVEGEPIDNVDKALSNGEEGKDDPVGQPLGVILLACSEQSVQGIVSRNDEASDVGEKLAAEVENNEEKVEGSDSDDGVRLGNIGRLLDVIKGGVLGQLTIELADVVLDAILSRHIGG